MPDSDHDRYSIRWFEPNDREGFLSLYGTAFGGGSDAWFEWKYVQNPATAHVPILVAEADGVVAGARPQVPFRMRVGGDDVLALRFGDTMVHPDHRRRGVFTRLTERALDHYTSMSAPRFCFNCPNDASRPGFLKAGGRLVTRLPSYYRVQNPAALLAGRADALPRTVARGATVGARAYLSARDRLASTSEEATVVRHTTIPTDLLANLYERHVPSGVHAVRDEAFLEWRYRNPDWEYVAYSASVDGRTVAALVTGRQTDEGVTVVNFVDVVPLSGGRTRRAGVRALLAAVTDDHADADLVAYSGHTVSPRLLADFGFGHDRSLPLSAVASPSTLLAYDLSGDRGPSWSGGGVDLTDPAGWALSYAELDAR